MLYKQHRFVGNSIVVGRNVKIPGRPKTTGAIVFARKERIEFTDTDFNSGDVAVKVTAYDTPPARAIFDNLRIWDAELR